MERTGAERQAKVAQSWRKKNNLEMLDLSGRHLDC